MLRRSRLLSGAKSRKRFSAGKFILVVMFYMHLKFDSRIFTGSIGATRRLAGYCW